MTLKVNANDPFVPYQPTVSHDACLVHIWWFQLKYVTSYRADKVKFTDGQTDGRTDGQAEATTIPFRPQRPRVKHWNLSRLVLKLCLPNPLKPGGKSRMKMALAAPAGDASTTSEWAIFHCLLRCAYIRRLTLIVAIPTDGWPGKTTGHLFYGTSSFVHHFKAIGVFKLKLQPGNAQFGSKSAIFCPVWPWNLMDDLEKQYGSSCLMPQALCIIS